jgi:O-antigen/teichoic acid export membrane protein
MLANIGANLVAIPTMGIAGAAMVTSLSLLLRVLISRRRVRRAIKAPALLRPHLPALAGAVPAAVLLAVVEVPVLLELAGAVGLYLPVWWWFTRRTDPEQLDVVASVVSVAGPRSEQ